MADPQVYSVIAELFAGAGAPPARGDWQARRNQSEAFYSGMFAAQFGEVDCVTENISVPVSDGSSIECASYIPKTGDFDRVIVYFHGGGFIGGSVVSHQLWCSWLAVETDSQVVSVGYRLAPESPAPIPQEDAYSAAAYFAARNEDDANPRPFVVGGDSSGAGLATSVALMARDRKDFLIDALFLIQPMLDDRTEQAPEDKLPLLTWSLDDNATAWEAVLGESKGTDGVSSYVAPGRATDLSNFPTTFLEICEIDLFFEEGFSLLTKLVNEGIPVEAHILRGVPHAFDVLAPSAPVSTRALANRIGFLKSILQ